MRFFRTCLLVVCGVTLTAYALDCSAVTTPEEAMQCCNTMPCSQHGQSEDCCKTMPTMHAPFVQPSPGRGASISSVGMELVPAFVSSQDLNSSARDAAAAHWHAPPILREPVPSPLRI